MANLKVTDFLSNLFAVVFITLNTVRYDDLVMKYRFLVFKGSLSSNFLKHVIYFDYFARHQYFCT